MKTIEIRDPIHGFVHLSEDEQAVIDSRPFQRLRHVHQLALSYLVYPSATHMRFEHSLGVMELAGRIYDVVTDENNRNSDVVRAMPDIADKDKLWYWRHVVRVAALFHDAGHLPFSHAAEIELLPGGWTHERLSGEIIKSPEMKSIWQKMTPRLEPEDILKLSIGPDKLKGVEFSTWEAILADIIVSDEFGADRMDYLLRDSHHAGVAYGKFDHYRLIDTLRILPPSPLSPQGDASVEPTLGVQEGGLYSAEALLLARYFMFAQVYYHRVRRICDIHLQDFLSEWLPGGRFSIDLEEFMKLTDNEVTAAICKSAANPGLPGHQHAVRIAHQRKQFKLLYERTEEEKEVNSDAATAIHRAAIEKFGSQYFRLDKQTQKGGEPNFPVLQRDGTIASSYSLSQVLSHVPVAASHRVFVAPEIQVEAKKWLETNRAEVIKMGATA